MNLSPSDPRDAQALSPREAALRLIEGDTMLSALLADASALLDDDPGHDLEHCLRVAGWGLRIGAEIDQREIVATALLHDLVNVPKDDPRRAQAGLLSANEARKLLPKYEFEEAAIERIAEAIEDHGFSRGVVPRSDLGRALQDADRLEALGALGIFRTISTGARMGSIYLHATDPWAENRPLNDMAHSVDHFFKKLLILHETLHTEEGRAEARRRTQFMESFLDQLADELGRPRPAAQG